jgi:hypothetical protein
MEPALSVGRGFSATVRSGGGGGGGRRGGMFTDVMKGGVEVLDDFTYVPRSITISVTWCGGRQVVCRGWVLQVLQVLQVLRGFTGLQLNSKYHISKYQSYLRNLIFPPSLIR